MNNRKQDVNRVRGENAEFKKVKVKQQEYKSESGTFEKGLKGSESEATQLQKV